MPAQQRPQQEPLLPRKHGRQSFLDEEIAWDIAGRDQMHEQQDVFELNIVGWLKYMIGSETKFSGRSMKSEEMVQFLKDKIAKFQRGDGSKLLDEEVRAAANSLLRGVAGLEERLEPKRERGRPSEFYKDSWTAEGIMTSWEQNQERGVTEAGGAPAQRIPLSNGRFIEVDRHIETDVRILLMCYVILQNINPEEDALSETTHYVLLNELACSMHEAIQISQDVLMTAWKAHMRYQFRTYQHVLGHLRDFNDPGYPGAEIGREKAQKKIQQFLDTALKVLDVRVDLKGWQKNYFIFLKMRSVYFLSICVALMFGLFAGFLTKVFYGIFVVAKHFKWWYSTCFAFFLTMPHCTILFALMIDQLTDLLVDITRDPVWATFRAKILVIRNVDHLVPDIIRDMCWWIDGSLLGVFEGVPIFAALLNVLQHGVKHRWYESMCLGYIWGGVMVAFVGSFSYLIVGTFPYLLKFFGSAGGDKRIRVSSMIAGAISHFHVFPGFLAEHCSCVEVYDISHHHVRSKTPVPAEGTKTKRWDKLLCYRIWYPNETFESLTKLTDGAQEGDVRRIRRNWWIQFVIFPNVLWVFTVALISSQSFQSLFVLSTNVVSVIWAIVMLFLSRAFLMYFPGVAGHPFYMVSFVLVCLTAFLLAGNAHEMSKDHIKNPLMRWQNASMTDQRPMTHWLGDSRGAHYSICRESFGSADANLSALDLAALSFIMYEPNCSNFKELLDQHFPEHYRANVTNCTDEPWPSRWAMFHFPAREGGNSGTRVMGVKGTSSIEDAMLDGTLYATVQVLQWVEYIIPVLTTLPIDQVQWLMKSFSLEHKEEKEAWDQIEGNLAYMVEQHPDDSFILTGHSLGGGLAQIIASKFSLPAVVWSAPGMVYSKTRFNVSLQMAKRNIWVVRPDHDIVPRVDMQAGTVQDISCRDQKGQPDTALNCHGLTKTACEVWRVCGDPLGRNFNSTCSNYIDQRLLGKTFSTDDEM